MLVLEAAPDHPCHFREPLWLVAAVLTQLPARAINELCESTQRHTHTDDHHRLVIPL